MSMDRDTARQLLPCFVCGDLPGPVAAQVQAVLDAHPDLQAQADDLRAAEETCRSLVAELAGQVPALALLDRAAPPEPLGAGRALLAVAAALLLVVLGAWRLGQHPPVDGLLAHHQAFATEQAPGFLAETDPHALASALMATRAGPYLGMVSDLSAMGLQVVGGGLTPGDRLGTAVVYTDGERRYVCQMFGGVAPTDPPALVEQVGAHTLRVYQVGELSVVVWQEGGMVCLFSGERPPAELLAMVQAKLGRRA